MSQSVRIRPASFESEHGACGLVSHGKARIDNHWEAKAACTLTKHDTSTKDVGDETCLVGNKEPPGHREPITATAELP